MTTMHQYLERQLKEAETKALRAMAGYKFYMFGYWAARWVQVNKDGGFRKPNPFKDYVILAKRRAKR